jgi:hypothetical protein
VGGRGGSELGLLIVCPVLRLNRTKMFHVKRFGTMGRAFVLLASYSGWPKLGGIARKLCKFGLLWPSWPMGLGISRAYDATEPPRRVAWRNLDPAILNRLFYTREAAFSKGEAWVHEYFPYRPFCSWRRRCEGVEYPTYAAVFLCLHRLSYKALAGNLASGRLRPLYLRSHDL